MDASWLSPPELNYHDILSINNNCLTFLSNILSIAPSKCPYCVFVASSACKFALLLF